MKFLKTPQKHPSLYEFITSQRRDELVLLNEILFKEVHAKIQTLSTE
jgi:hypothetical protein